MSVTSRQELMDSLRGRYRSGSRVETRRILDEFVAVTGYHRKHAIRLLKLGRVARPAVARTRPCPYGNAGAEALVVLWVAADRFAASDSRHSSRLCLMRWNDMHHATEGQVLQSHIAELVCATTWCPEMADR